MSTTERLEQKLEELHRYHKEHTGRMKPLVWKRLKKQILDTEQAIDREHLRNSPCGGWG